MSNLCSVSCALLFFLLISIQQHGVQLYEVKCLDQQEVCECPPEEEDCEFILTIEELQTFTSYVIEDGDLLSRGTPGDVYFLDSSGYHPAVPDSAIPERGRCYINKTPLVYDRNFNGAGRNGTNCSVPMTVDGKTYRMFIAVNGRLPGPTLIVSESSLVRVSVVNKLTSEGITIHWHGMHQKGTPWMDGVGFISQDPVTPGATFDYIFRAIPPGTHWYHSHVGAQRTDGLFGALIVRENNFVADIVPAIMQELPDIEFEEIEDKPKWHTMTLLDWQSEASLSLFVQIHSTLGFWENKPIGVLPNRQNTLSSRTYSADKIEVGAVPYWSGLINGRGRMDGDTLSPVSVFTVLPNRAYRFRIIGAQSLYAYAFSIDEHTLRVIAADGHFIRPKEVDYLVVHSGERYDVIVDTYNHTIDKYWIRAKTLETMTSNGKPHSALAILNYNESDIEYRDVDWTRPMDPAEVGRTCTSDNKCNVLNCPFDSVEGGIWNCIHLHTLTALSPLNSPLSPGPAWYDDSCGSECLHFFNFGFEGDSDTSAVNARNFKFPSTDYQTNCGQYDTDFKKGEICDESCKETIDMNGNPRPTNCKCVHVAKIVQNQSEGSKKTVFFVLSAVGDISRRLNNFSHPIHLHGHSFYIIYIGHGGYRENGELVSNSPDVSCYDDPLCMKPGWGNKGMPASVLEALGDDNRVNNSCIRKDTVIVPAGGYVVVAFPADNPGYWFLHCHIEAHQLEGMAVLIEEYPYKKHRAPPNGINNIGSFNWTISDYKRLQDKWKYCVIGGPSGYEIATIVLGVCLGLGLALLLVILFLCRLCQLKGKSDYDTING